MLSCILLSFLHLADFQSQDEYIATLQQATTTEVYSALLHVQTDAMFPREALFLDKHPFWHNAKSVLDMGCGNGEYVSRLQKRFSDKSYVGIDKDLPFLDQAKCHANESLTFEEFDAQTNIDQFHNSFDVVLARLSLQYMNDPRAVLEHAHAYLKEGGHLVIMEIYDPASQTSHTYPYLDELTQLHNDTNKSASKGNRKISLEIVQEMNAAPLNHLYELVYTNLDAAGTMTERVLKWETPEENRQDFTISMLYFSLLQKYLDIPVDLKRGYQELLPILSNTGVWSAPGMHYLILQKKSLDD